MSELWLFGQTMTDAQFVALHGDPEEDTGVDYPNPDVDDGISGGEGTESVPTEGVPA